MARTVKSHPLLCKSAGEKRGDSAVLERTGRGSLGEGLPVTGRALGFSVQQVAWVRWNPRRWREGLEFSENVKGYEG